MERLSIKATRLSTRIRVWNGWIWDSARIFQRTGSASPYGTFDEGGNAWEWNEQIVFGSRGVRGGSWANNASNLAASSPIDFLPADELDGIGFRVASLVPEPGTGLLLMTGLAGLAARQERRKRNP